MDIVEEINAAKNTISGKNVWETIRDAKRIIVTSGKKILEFDPSVDDPEEIVSKVSGRTGNLRAPSLRIGDCWYIGFNEMLYKQIQDM